MQQTNCEEYIIPFIEAVYPIKPDSRILEIGCGTAGVLSAFLKRECQSVGVDLNAYSVEFAGKKLNDFIKSGKLTLFLKDIYQIDVETELKGRFDIIVLKDVIEHIHNQERLMTEMKSFLKPDGVIFLGFPPWQMPFGGHQQMCQNKFLARLPYFHLLPMSLYKRILNIFHESLENLTEVKETGISIERFEKITKNTGYKIVNECHFLINPIYKYKFGMKVRKQVGIIRSVPYLRDFLTTGVFYLIRQN
jgi:SAM-dependent methyltransferase